eukprot:749032-Hanusia_phi.AAC.4
MFQAISLYGKKNRDGLVQRFAANLPQSRQDISGYVLCQTGTSPDSVRADLPVAIPLQGDQMMVAVRVLDLLLHDFRFHCVPPGDLADCEICAVFTMTAQGSWVVNGLDSRVFIMVNDALVASSQLKAGDRVSFCVRASGLDRSDATATLFTLDVQSAHEYYNKYAASVSLLSCSSALVDGTKELSFSMGKDASNAPEDPPRDFTIVSLCTPVLKILLEDDLSSRTEELLHLYMEDVKVSIISDGDARQMSASVLKLQLDNQYDNSTALPVVMCVNAEDAGAAALNVAIVEKLGRAGLGSFFQHIRLEFGDSYLFVEDKLVVRIGEFVTRFLASGNAKGQRGGSNEDEEISEEIRMVRRQFLDEACQGEAPSQVLSEKLVFLEDFRMKPMNIHLTLLFSGDNKSSETVRKFAGAIVEAMEVKKMLNTESFCLSLLSRLYPPFSSLSRLPSPLPSPPPSLFAPSCLFASSLSPVFLSSRSPPLHCLCFTRPPFHPDQSVASCRDSPTVSSAPSESEEEEDVEEEGVEEG